MKLWIIYSKVVLNPNKNNAISWMLDEASTCNFDAEVLFAEDIVMETNNELIMYYQGQKQDLPDVILSRCYDISMIKHFELAGIRVFNSSIASNNCLDKWTTHQLLTQAGIPTPRTLYSEHGCDYEFVKTHLNSPFILKNTIGAKGEQVYLIHNENEFNQALSHCSKPLFQTYIQTSYGKDVRLHVIGDKVVASVLRVSNSDFKSNFSQGGSANSFEPDETIKELAVKSTQALGLDFSGVDILFTEDGYTVCEVNGVPGFRTVGLTSKYNIPNAMMAYIKTCMRRQL